jgi:hypothetical protein
MGIIMLIAVVVLDVGFSCSVVIKLKTPLTKREAENAKTAGYV